jgi:hypothetical protein
VSILGRGWYNWITMANNDKNTKREGTLLEHPVTLHSVYSRRNITHIRFDGRLFGKSNSNVSFSDGAECHARFLLDGSDRILVTQKGGLFEVWPEATELYSAGS